MQTPSPSDHGQNAAATKRYWRGTHRTAPPTDTLARLQPLLAGAGITRVANVTGLDRIGLPVVTACRPNARSLAVYQGKGLDLEAAKASAIMEAMETYHAEHIAAPLRLGNVERLGPELPLLDVAELPRSSLGGFDEKLDLLWLEGRNWLDRETPIWVPLETVSTDYTLPLPPGSGCFAASTNGLAAGNTLLEAVSHGLCEVVERDAVTLWKLAGAKARGASHVALETVDSAPCQEVLERLARATLQVRVWEVTSDVGIAAFCCLLYGDEDDWADPEFGAGCHPSREVALLRALTEATQARTTFIAGARDDLGSALYSPSARRRRRVYCHQMAASAVDGGRAFREAPNLDSDRIDHDLDWMLRRLRAVGVEQAAVVDLSRPTLDIPVVRVVVPGLEGPYGHEQTDFVPGRRARQVMPTTAWNT